jgi:c-di-GMP-binding flagellar brake protein YcgR
MIDEEKERRRFRRVFFSIDDGVKGILAFSDLQRGVLAAHIINISEGGLGLALDKDKKNRIARGDSVILTHITGIERLEFLVNVDAEIKWIMDDPSLEFVGFGCEFLDVPQPIRDAVETFIDSWSAK